MAIATFLYTDAPVHVVNMYKLKTIMTIGMSQFSQQNFRNNKKQKSKMLV